MQKKYTQIIDAPIETVFLCLSDYEKMKLWMDGQVQTRFKSLTTDNISPVGIKFQQDLAHLVQINGQVLSCAAPIELGLAIEVSGLKGTVYYNLKALTDSKTKMNFNLEVFGATKSLKMLLSSLLPLFDYVIKRHLAGLKKLAEHHITA